MRFSDRNVDGADCGYRGLISVPCKCLKFEVGFLALIKFQQNISLELLLLYFFFLKTSVRWPSKLSPMDRDARGQATANVSDVWQPEMDTLLQLLNTCLQFDSQLFIRSIAIWYLCVFLKSEEFVTVSFTWIQLGRAQFMWLKRFMLISWKCANYSNIFLTNQSFDLAAVFILFLFSVLLPQAVALHQKLHPYALICVLHATGHKYICERCCSLLWICVGEHGKSHSGGPQVHYRSSASQQNAICKLKILKILDLWVTRIILHMLYKRKCL